jgi:hypothetical protein
VSGLFVSTVFEASSVPPAFHTPTGWGLSSGVPGEVSHTPSAVIRIGESTVNV